MEVNKELTQMLANYQLNKESINQEQQKAISDKMEQVRQEKRKKFAEYNKLILENRIRCKKILFNKD
jgi:TRAP-type C4-dicarboxylate transport system substrate-binding protein